MHRVSVVSLSEAERSRFAALEEPALARSLAVYTAAGPVGGDTPAIAGSHFLDAEGLHFRPLFPFVSGVRYSARLDLGDRRLLVRDFELLPPAGEAPRVTAVFPSGDALPENTLRIYLHFSRPMEARNAHRHVRLLDDAGRSVPLAFVEVPHGLWDPGRKRLTVLFHPGRIKRGVAPGERLGPPLRAGSGYRLVVDAAMRDAAGLSLGRDFEWRVRATAADREPPQAEALRVRAPGAATAALVLELPEPLDEAQLQRLVRVEDADGQGVAGSVAISEGETRWSFSPERPWASGSYRVVVNPALEDRAGNRFGRAFDREPATSDEAAPAVAGPLRFEFRVEAGPR